MSKAMVIDDSRAIRMILSGILGELGCEVETAVNGKDGLHKAAQGGDWSVFLVDWNMPEMTGLEFVEAVRKDQRFANTPLMMVTTETEISQVARALEAGANEYVMKPFTKDMIEEKLRLLGVVQ
jgi:two-component system, chemotaxis family, chemotaxis protein CheY